MIKFPGRARGAMAGPASSAPRTNLLRRRCACGNSAAAGGTCAACKQKQTLRRRAGGAVAAAGAVPAVVHEALRSSGHRLDGATRALMEPRFGRDFSAVRVHTDAVAARSADAVGALAYTVGRDVVFGAGQYVPHNASGRALLAHELTHVAQNGVAASAGQLRMGDPGSAEEHAAERNEQPGGAAPVVAPAAAGQLRRKGGTVGGFFANIGRGIASALTGSEASYDEATLEAYLQVLRTTQAIEDDFDSDNKARAVVAQKRFGAESTQVLMLLIHEMLSGYRSGDDMRAIETLADAVSYERLFKEVKGAELDLLYEVLPKMSMFHPREEKKHTSLTMEEYIQRWEKEQGRSMSPAERRALAYGCIGITMLNTGSLNNPDLTECYGTFEQAWNASRTMNAFIEQTGVAGKKAIVFSKRFWSAGRDYKPDPQSGKVDMSTYTYEAKPGFVNFDYGFYDEKKGTWWHANHCDAPTLANPDCGGAMIVYESNLTNYSRPLRDFDRQVFCVGVSLLS